MHNFAIITLSVFITLFNNIAAQCFKENYAFSVGEKIEYEAYYNWGFIWLNAGFVEFDVKAGSYLNQPVYHLDIYGASHENYDWIFKVRDRYQSYLNKETLLPVWAHRVNYEGGFEVDNEYIFNNYTNQVYSATQTSDRPFKRDTLNIPPCTYDMISMVYYCRNLDFENMTIGEKIPLRAILDNELFELYIRYLGKETIETREKEKYRCIKFSALLIEGSIFEGGEDLYIWVTDDKNRVPILVEAKILIGSVKAYIKSMSGLRNPIEAKIE